MTSESWREHLAEQPAPTRVVFSGPPRPMERWSGVWLSPGAHPVPALVTVAQTEAASAQLRHEEASRSWAQGAGVPVPRALADGETWMIAELLDVLPPVGSDYVMPAVAAARAIREYTVAPPKAVSDWGGSRRTLMQRVVRSVMGGLPLGEFRRIRSEAADLPALFWAHGDYGCLNVLRHPGGIAVIDWEFVGRAPLGTDELRLWSTLSRRADRDLLMEQLLDTTSSAHHPDLGLLAHWLALRLLAENLAAPSRYRNDETLDVARAAVVEGRNWHSRLAAASPIA